MNNPMKGVQYFIDGFALVFKPGIKRFVIIPVCINIILFIGFFFLLRYFVGEFNAWFTSYLPSWLQWLSTVLWVLFVISFMLIFVFTFVTIANIIAAPFNGLLAEQVERYLTGREPESRSLWDNVKDVPRMMGRQLAIIIYYLPRALLLLILFLLPLIQVIAPILWFLFNAWFLTLTYIDYPTDNHKIALNDVREWLNERRSVALGFGITALIATMIPVLNFFTIPVAVAAATKFWVAESKRKKSLAR